METSFVLSNGNLQVPCILTEPQQGSIRRIILGVHGLGGSSTDAIQAGIAEEMELLMPPLCVSTFLPMGEIPQKV